VPLDIGILLSACLVGYALGALSFTRFIVHIIAPKTDLRMSACRSRGLPNQCTCTPSARIPPDSSWGQSGGLIGVLDIFKVFLPTLAFRLLFPGQPYHLFTALFAIVGHDWPIYYRFKGGRGISATYGGLLAIDWLGATITSLGGMGSAYFYCATSPIFSQSVCC